MLLFEANSVGNFKTVNEQNRRRTVNEEMKALLHNRRTIPAQFLSEPGPDDRTIRSLLTIASRVPDHGKLVPWRFIVIRGEARKRFSASFCEMALKRDPSLAGEGLEKEKTRFTRAPVIIAVVSRAASHPKIPEWEQVLSAGACCMNLVMAAHAYGFVGNWLTEWMAYDDEALAMIGIDREEKVAGFIHIGTPSVPPSDRPRPDLDEIVSWID